MTRADQQGETDHGAFIRTWAEGLRRALLPFVGGLVLLVLVAGLVFLDPFGWRQPSAVESTTASPAATSIETAEGSLSDGEAAAAVLLALTDDPAQSVAAAARESFDAAVALPPGSKLAPEPASWGTDGIGGGTMNVVLSIPGQPDTRYVAVMVKEGGHWKVLGTLEQSEGPAAP